MSKLLAIGRDNPNVNKKLMRLLINKYNTKDAADSYTKILDYGACVLHVCHNAFKCGLKAVPIDLSQFAISIHGFFKYSVLRREDFTNELIDLEETQENFLRHVSSRWLSLKPALERIEKHWIAIEQYFLTTLPAKAREGDQNAKDALKSKYYELVVTKLRMPECRFMTRMVIYTSEKFSPFMHKLQSKGPQIADLYMDCSRLLLEVLACFLKKSVIPNSHSQMMKLDLTKDHRELPKMSPSASESYKSLSPVHQRNAKKAVEDMFLKIANYMYVNLHPLKSKLVKNLRVLEPKNRADLVDGGASAITEAAKEVGRFSGSQIDTIALQWELLEARKFSRRDGERIDSFYAKCLKNLITETEKFKELGTFIKIVLSLPCSNASIERGFSQGSMSSEQMKTEFSQFTMSTEQITNWSDVKTNNKLGLSGVFFIAHIIRQIYCSGHV